MMYRLEKTQQLKCSIETAWKFFSSPHNLEKITPKEMKFRVLSEIEADEIFEGMLIDYRVRPMLNIPVHWQTKITHVDFQKSFTDFQLKGPYEIWNHFHEFEANEDGVLMHDVVDYQLPLSFLGNLAHSLFVKRKLDHIFEYRHQVLEELFNKNSAL